MTSPGTPYSTKPEMFWRADPLVDAARKLPEWVAFHKLCGRSAVAFDHIEREGKRGQYLCTAFRPVKTAHGGWQAVTLAVGRGADVLGAMGDAYRKCGVDVPGAADMLDRRLRGLPRTVAPTAATDSFEELFG